MSDAKFTKRVELLEGQLKNSTNLQKRVLDMETALKEANSFNKRTLVALDKRVATLEKISKVLVASVKDADSPDMDKAVGSLHKELLRTDQKIASLTDKTKALLNNPAELERQKAKLEAVQKENKKLEQALVAVETRAEKRVNKEVASLEAARSKERAKFEKEQAKFESARAQDRKDVEARIKEARQEAQN